MRTVGTIHGVAARRVGWGASGAAIALILGGCATSGSRARSDRSDQALALLLPTRIEIVGPSTRLHSPSGSGKPEVLELLLRGYTVLENPGAILVGDVRVELYTFQPASADNKGERICAWDISLRDKDQQHRFWNPIIQMYEFNLGIESAAIPRASKYVLSSTYRSPLETHLTDELVFDLTAAGGSPSTPVP